MRPEWQLGLTRLLCPERPKIKLGLRDRVHAVIHAYEHGVLEPGGAVGGR